MLTNHERATIRKLLLELHQAESDLYNYTTPQGFNCGGSNRKMIEGMRQEINKRRTSLNRYLDAITEMNLTTG